MPSIESLREVIRERRDKQVRLEFLNLFNLRKYADHRGVFFTEEEARDIVRTAEELEFYNRKPRPIGSMASFPRRNRPPNREIGLVGPMVHQFD